MEIALAIERADQQGGIRQYIAIALASPKWVFGLGETLTTTTLIGL
jgi:hypothetical protein